MAQSMGVYDVTGYGGSPAMSGGNSTGSSQSQTQTAIVPGMGNIYSQLLGMNQQNYGNMMQAYSQGQNNLSGQLPGVYGKYGQLSQDVGNTLGMGQVLGQNGNWGVAAPAAQAIKEQQAKTAGDTTNQMINSGLGNTTARFNAQNQNAYQTSKAYGNLGAQLATQAAQQQADIGKSGLAAQMQGLGLQTGLSQAQGGTLGNYKYANTAGDLTGNFGSSSSTNTSQQQSRGPIDQPGGQGGGGSGANAFSPPPAGAPGGPAGGGSGYGGYVPAGGGAGGAPVGIGGGGGGGDWAPGVGGIGKGPGGPTTISPGEDKPYGPMSPSTGPVGTSKEGAPPDMTNAYGSQGNTVPTNEELQNNLQQNPMMLDENGQPKPNAFGATSIAPNAGPWSPGDGAIMDAKGGIIGWSPWGIGGKSGPPLKR